MDKQIVINYIQSLQSEIDVGNYTEHTFRPYLKILIESFQQEIIAINEPRRIEHGAPDFLISRNNFPLGYIETKKIGSNLDAIIESKQISRYLQGISNLIITNYTEFRWYYFGELKFATKLANINENNHLAFNSHNNFHLLITSFFGVNINITKPYELAKGMATYASLITKELQQLLNNPSTANKLKQQLEGFRLVLLSELSEEELSDMYAQTICYGLFAARCVVSTNEEMNRHNASYIIPKTNPFLRKMFDQIVGPDLHVNLEWMVDDLIALLNSTEMDKVLNQTKDAPDPIIHFYESFLTYYNQSLRTLRGVFFTPKPIVKFMVKSVNKN